MLPVKLFNLPRMNMPCQGNHHSPHVYTFYNPKLVNKYNCLILHKAMASTWLDVSILALDQAMELSNAGHTEPPQSSKQRIDSLPTKVTFFWTILVPILLEYFKKKAMLTMSTVPQQSQATAWVTLPLLHMLQLLQRWSLKLHTPLFSSLNSEALGHASTN